MDFAQSVNAIVHRTASPRFLLLKPKPTTNEALTKWQTVTGTVEAQDDSLKDAALREVAAATGIARVVGVRDLGHAHTFEREGRLFVEHAFGIEVEDETHVTLAEAYALGQWVNADEAEGLFRVPADRAVFQRLVRALENESG